MKYQHIEDSDVVRRGHPIPRVSRISRANFHSEFLTGIGRPVIVTDAMDDWAAKSKWTFEFFSRTYPSAPVIANSPFFLENMSGLSPVKAQLNLRDYVEYVINPGTPPRCHYMQGSWEALQSNGIPLYAPGYRVFSMHPELRSDLSPSPYFADDFLVRLPGYLQQVIEQLPSPIHYLFFAPEGAVAFLHTDFWETHAYLAQLVGRKFCILFSPQDAENLYFGRVLDPVYCDTRQFPMFSDAIPYCGELRAGDLIFIPSGWYHFVVTMSASLTFSYDFFNATNFAPFMSNLFLGLARMVVAPNECRNLTAASQILSAALREAAMVSSVGQSNVRT
jgi:hypothetical protein